MTLCFPPSSLPLCRLQNAVLRLPGAGRTLLFEGESGRNPTTRELEHVRDLTYEENTCSSLENGTNETFSMVALKGYNGCLLKQVNEAVRETNFVIFI